jgi:hypothetical protein
VPDSTYGGAEARGTRAERAQASTIARPELHATEVTVTDPAGRGYRTWIGADLAPTAALRLCATVVRLLGSNPT